MKLASQIYPEGMAASSELRKDIYDLIQTYRPYNIIETGTYLGLGSTSALIHGLTDAKLSLFSLISIESNKEFYDQAMRNIGGEKYIGSLVLMHANSLPSEMMPKQIHAAPMHVITDHADPSEYLKEVPADIPDDGIMKAMKLIDFRPDMVLLDSAGHLGRIEFEYICNLSESGFVLILDDTLHRKHYDTLQFIKQHPNDFRVLKESTEKFGHALVLVK